MIAVVTIASLLALLQAWDNFAVVRQVQAQASVCTALTPQNCLDHSAVPLGSTARANNTGCWLNAGTCAYFPSTDPCQAQVTAAGCNAASCFYDSSLQVCSSSLAYINNVFPCTYWSGQLDTSGNNPSCAYHGCAYNTASKTCASVTSEGIVSNNITSPPIYTTATFVNPTVLANSQTFQVSVIVPFVYTASSPSAPAWPLIQILGNSLGSTSLRTFSEANSSACSSFNSTGYTEPVPFQNGFSVATMIANLRSSVSAANKLDFDTSTAIGQALFKTLGRMGQGLVNGVSYDGANFNFSISVNLTQAVQQCGANRGVAITYQSDGQTYALPLSYVEHRQNVFSRTSMVYNIKFSLTGQVSIGATAQYRRSFYTTATSIVQADCPTNSARLLVNNTLVVRDVLDSSSYIAVNASTPQFATSFGFSGVTNCYADTIDSVDNLGCDRSAQTCSFNIGLRSQCRALTDDGLAFSQCDRGPTAQRTADVGAGNAYPISLDGVHNVFATLQTCPNAGGVCKLAVLSSTGSPDLYTTNVKTSAYLAQTTTANPFSIVAGFLPTPTSTQSTFQDLAGINATSVPSSGIFAPVRKFDGNIGSNQPVTVAILLPASIRTTYDLRMLTPNTTVVALDADGRQLGFDASGAVIPGFALKTSATYREIASSLLYTVKNDYDAGCGAQQSCFLLPACVGTLGCDGFSVPTQQLRNLMPANGYGFAVGYRIGLTNADGSAPNARIDAGRQLSALRRSQSSLKSSNAVIQLSERQLLASGTNGEQQTFDGTVYFTVQVNGNNTVSVLNVRVQPNSEKLDSKTKASLIAGLAVPGAWVLLYAAISWMAFVKWQK